MRDLLLSKTQGDFYFVNKSMTHPSVSCRPCVLFPFIFTVEILCLLHKHHSVRTSSDVRWKDYLFRPPQKLVLTSIFPWFCQIFAQSDSLSLRHSCGSTFFKKNQYRTKPKMLQNSLQCVCIIMKSSSHVIE